MKWLAASWLAMLACLPAGWAADDVQAWQRVSVSPIRTERFNLSTFGELRVVDDASRPNFYLVSEQARYEVHRNLGLGVNYTFINNGVFQSSTGDRKFQWQHRFEIEVTPRWRTFAGLGVKNRNRVEFRRIEGRGSDNTRLRHLWEVGSPRRGRMPPLFSNFELFYDVKSGRVTENRLAPIGVALGPIGKTQLRLSYQAQSQKGASRWSTSHALVSQLSF